MGRVEVGGAGSWGDWGKGSPSPGAGSFCVGVAGDVGWGAPRWAGPTITPLVLVALGTFRRFGLFQAVWWKVVPRGRFGEILPQGTSGAQSSGGLVPSPLDGSVVLAKPFWNFVQIAAGSSGLGFHPGPALRLCRLGKVSTLCASVFASAK